MRLACLLSATLSSTSNLLLQLDSEISYNSSLLDEETASVQQDASTYVSLATKEFDVMGYQTESRGEEFVCQKYEDLMRHARNSAKFVDHMDG